MGRILVGLDLLPSWRGILWVPHRQERNLIFLVGEDKTLLAYDMNRIKVHVLLA